MGDRFEHHWHRTAFTVGPEPHLKRERGERLGESFKTLCSALALASFIVTLAIWLP